MNETCVVIARRFSFAGRLVTGIENRPFISIRKRHATFTQVQSLKHVSVMGHLQIVWFRQGKYAYTMLQAFGHGTDAWATNGGAQHSIHAGGIIGRPQPGRGINCPQHVRFDIDYIELFGLVLYQFYQKTAQRFGQGSAAAR